MAFIAFVLNLFTSREPLYVTPCRWMTRNCAAGFGSFNIMTDARWGASDGAAGVGKQVRSALSGVIDGCSAVVFLKVCQRADIMAVCTVISQIQVIIVQIKVAIFPRIKTVVLWRRCST